MKIFFAILFLSASNWIASAKLGETPEQIKLRYGPPSALASDDPSVVSSIYEVKGRRIIVNYFRGAAAEETIESQKDESIFSDEHCVALASAIAGNTKENWKNRYHETNWVHWESPGYEADLSLTPRSFMFNVSTTEYSKHVAEKIRNEEKKAEDDLLTQVGGSSKLPATPPEAHQSYALPTNRVTLITLKGETYSQIKIIKLEREGVVYTLPDGAGGGKIKFADLTPESVALFAVKNK